LRNSSRITPAVSRELAIAALEECGLQLLDEDAGRALNRDELRER
jgi:hypothetical protein